MLSTLAIVSSHDELTTLQKKLSLPSGCERIRGLVVEKKTVFGIEKTEHWDKGL